MTSFVKPTGSDLIRDGDNNISQNATATEERLAALAADIAAVAYWHGAIPLAPPTNLDTLPPGVYAVWSQADGLALALPADTWPSSTTPSAAGVLTASRYGDTGRIQTWMPRGDLAPQLWQRHWIGGVSGSWTSWTRMDGPYKGRIGPGRRWGTLDAAPTGWTAVAATDAVPLGLPTAAAGLLETLTVPDWTLQRYTTAGHDTQSWERRRDAGGWTSWRRTDIGNHGSTIGLELRTDTNLASDVAAAWVFEDGSIAARLFRDGTLDAKIGTAPATGLGLVAYGDSTTYGADLADPAGQRWTTLLGDALGRIVANRGLSGARAEEIAAFAGGVTITGTVTGDSIPAAGNAALASSSLDVDPWRAGMGPVFGPRFPVLAVIDGDTPIPGELIYQNASLRYFARSTPGAAIPTTTLEMLASDTSGTLFLGAGTNNVPLVISGTQTVDDVVAWYRAITEAWTGPVIVWGILDRGYNERPGTATGDVIDDLDARLASGYGSHYVPVRRYLSSPRALTDAARLVPGFDATAEDLTAQSVGRTPPSFRAAVSSVHLNALGHRLQARLLHRHMILRGLA